MYTIKQKPEDFKVKEVSKVLPSGKGSYIFAVLKKKDYTTMSAIKILVSFLGLKMKHFGFAGTKDRQAITEQMISIHIPAPGIIQKLQKFSHENISVRIIGKSDSPISLGDLEGNKFEIVVRDATTDPEVKDRFVNFFGEQRFSKNNAEVGKMILQGKFNEAVKAMDESEISKEVSDNPSDPIRALKTLPKKILLMYLHSYQSLLWNRAVENYLQSHDKEKTENILIPLIGFGTELEEYDSELADIYGTILKEEEMTERDFIIRKMPEMSLEGGERNLFADVKDLRITKKEKGMFKLEFFLPKGSYATELVKQMFE